MEVLALGGFINQERSGVYIELQISDSHSEKRTPQGQVESSGLLVHSFTIMGLHGTVDRLCNENFSDARTYAAE